MWSKELSSSDWTEMCKKTEDILRKLDAVVAAGGQEWAVRFIIMISFFH